MYLKYTEVNMWEENGWKYIYIYSANANKKQEWQH